ncbi:Pac2p [Rhodotorula paludigena]|uniref:Pac2p n=1 Tax=Rhodotorula paludigena TaxID=86838 RepID=UPI00317C2D19
MLPDAVDAAELHLRCQYSPPLSSSSAPASDSTASSSRQLGTILYHGFVPPTKGVWYGIEWDDPTRGKHSGVYDKTGVRYFLPRVEGAGSFLRSDAKGLDAQGRTFEEAVRAKYLDDDGPPASADDTAAPPVAQPASDAASTSQRFATDGNFEVEVVLSDRVNRRFKQLGRLREIGLEWETVGRAAEEVYCEEEVERVEARLRSFGAELSGLETLNLSYSMLPSLQEVERITAVLPRLRNLAVNSNRFTRIDRLAQLSGFDRLTQLQLNSTLMTWNEIRNVSPSLVNLVDLQFGFNRLASLRSFDAGDPTSDSHGVMLPKLERLNLESNELSDWPELVRELSCLPQLSDLVLAGNRFVSLDLSTSPPGVAAASKPTASPPLPNVERLSLVENLLSSFSDSIDALASAAPITFPSLRRLLLAGNPLLSRKDTSATATITAPADHTAKPHARPSHTLDRDALHARLLVLARMPFLSELEGSPVVPAERDDAERFWLERLRDGEKGEARDMHEQLGAWSRERVQQLRKKYPELDPAANADAGGKGAIATKTGLKSRLIRLRIVPAEPLASSPSAPFELSVLPTLRTLLLRTQISRSLGTPLTKTKYRLVAVLQPAATADEGSPGEEVRVEIPPQEEGKDVAWWGLSDGDSVEILAV